jgi:iron complex transport system permease protein
MKVTLDLDLLVSQGKLSTLEAERLKSYASQETTALGSNIFLAFGIVAVVIGAGVLLPTLETVLVLGGLLFALGFALRIGKVERLALFAQIVMVAGALALGGAIIGLFGGSLLIKLLLAAGLAVAAIAAMSGLLASLSVVSLGAAIMTGSEMLEPSSYLTVTIVILSALVLALYIVSLRLQPLQEGLAIIAMRTAILMVNVAFYAGTLFGDSVLGLPSEAFTVVWALALVLFGTWAVFADRRWVVNSVAVFGAIHFFTQWFMALGAQPFSILVGGLLLIGFGLALARFNQMQHGRRHPPRPLEA